MSYRSVKRVLGETNLEVKCLILFGASLLLLISGSFYWFGTKTEQLVDSQNPKRGQLLVDTLITLRHWETFERNEDFKPVVVELSDNLKSHDYDGGFIKTDATYICTTAGRTADSTSTLDPEGKPKPRPLDPFEKSVLERFLNTKQTEPLDPDKPVEHTQRTLDGGKTYEYFQPIYYTNESCVGCHRAFVPLERLHDDRRPDLGGLVAVAAVRFSNSRTQEDLNLNRAILLSTAIITMFLAVIASYVIVRYVIVKPLKHLRDVSDAVSRGDIEQRAELHTGDEFEELGTAFNRMLRHLVDAQAELRQANANLDGKVDELAQLNLRLFEMNRLKSDFMATMSHELRTPLNSIIGFSDVLGSINSLDEKQKRYVQNIQKSGKMLLDMINDILDLAKVESGKMEVRISEFRIEHVIGAQSDMARPLTEKKNIDLVCDVPPHLPPLLQDQSKVQQILNNLLSNAIKFTPEGGRIVVSARRNDADELELVVADTGVGIAEEDQVAIFEKFRQGNTVLPGGDAMTREYSGTGLGLSIVKELCKLLEGEVSLKSELGKGSMFTIRIPWSLNEPPKATSPLNEAVDGLAKPRRGDFERPLGRPVSVE